VSRARTQPTILPLVRKHVLTLLNGYIKVPAITGTYSA
jgi:hypothetical protein